MTINTMNELLPLSFKQCVKSMCTMCTCAHWFFMCTVTQHKDVHKLLPKIDKLHIKKAILHKNLLWFS